MELILGGLLFIGIILGGLFLANQLLGHGKGHIVIDFDERYFNRREYIQAITNELESEGRLVTYEGHDRFTIDGKRYVFFERNLSMGGAPLQRTILKPEND
jgi:hypothetical protein